MNAIANGVLNVNAEELSLLIELLEDSQTRLLVEIRRTDHRAFREELRHRLSLVEDLLTRCKSI